MICLIDLNAGPKNAWLNSVGTTNVIYSTEVDTNDQSSNALDHLAKDFLTDEILPFTNILGRRPIRVKPGMKIFDPLMEAMAQCGVLGDRSLP